MQKQEVINTLELEKRCQEFIATHDAFFILELRIMLNIKSNYFKYKKSTIKIF